MSTSDTKFDDLPELEPNERIIKLEYDTTKSIFNTQFDSFNLIIADTLSLSSSVTSLSDASSIQFIQSPTTLMPDDIPFIMIEEDSQSNDSSIYSNLISSTPLTSNPLTSISKTKKWIRCLSNYIPFPFKSYFIHFLRNSMEYHWIIYDLISSMFIMLINIFSYLKIVTTSNKIKMFMTVSIASIINDILHFLHSQTIDIALKLDIIDYDEEFRDLCIASPDPQPISNRFIIENVTYSENTTSTPSISCESTPEPSLPIMIENLSRRSVDDLCDYDLDQLSELTSPNKNDTGIDFEYVSYPADDHENDDNNDVEDEGKDDNADDDDFVICHGFDDSHGFY